MIIEDSINETGTLWSQNEIEALFGSKFDSTCIKYNSLKSALPCNWMKGIKSDHTINFKPFTEVQIKFEGN